MTKTEMVRLVFKVTPEEKEIIEKALSAVRGNIGSESRLEEEMGQCLVMMAKMVISDYKS